MGSDAAPSTTRLKFVVARVDNNPGGVSVDLEAKYDPANVSEDEHFATVNPGGRLIALFSNPEDASHFQIGDAYYIDLTKVPNL